MVGVCGAGAYRSYRMRGVEDALDVDTMRTGSDTVMFFVVLDDAGQMLAGLRAKGPLRSADDSHAVVEWAGQPSQQAVRDMINDRVPFGVLEMKSGWVADDADRDLDLTTPLARSPFHMMALIDVQFCMATAASYVLNRWRSSGGAVAGIPATPYPDERYQTKMIWWNRRDFVRHADPAQVAKTLIETSQLTRECYGQRDVRPAVGLVVAVGQAAGELLDRRIRVGQRGGQRAADEVFQFTDQPDRVRRIETQVIEPAGAIDLAGGRTGAIRNLLGQHRFNVFVALHPTSATSVPANRSCASSTAAV